MNAILRALAFLVVAAGLIGFIGFSRMVAGYPALAPTQNADAIVVLTGDRGRLLAGSAVLQSGGAPVMLISGVHPDVTQSDIQTQTQLETRFLDCCVALGRTATDTIGNARETASWAEDNGYQSLIIVTSDYHLPRSLTLLSAAMPDVELLPYPVRTSPPWRNPGAARLWVQEYAKFATVWIGYRLTGRTGSRL